MDLSQRCFPAKKLWHNKLLTWRKKGESVMKLTKESLKEIIKEELEAILEEAEEESEEESEEKELRPADKERLKRGGSERSRSKKRYQRKPTRPKRR